jgi:hypothetical protein
MTLSEIEIMANAKSLGAIASQLLKWQKKLEDKEKQLEDREQTLRRSFLEVKKLEEKYGRRSI